MAVSKRLGWVLITCFMVGVGLIAAWGIQQSLLVAAGITIADKVEVHDLNATILKLMGIDDKRLTFPYQGLDQRLTGVDEDGHIVKQILA